MQAKEMTLEPLLEGQKQYLAPLYQRTYAWQRDQLDRLWTDILAQADALRDHVRTESPPRPMRSASSSPSPGGSGPTTSSSPPGSPDSTSTGSARHPSGCSCSGGWRRATATRN